MVGCRTDNQVDVARIQKLLVCSVALRELLFAVARARAVGRCAQAALRIDVEEVTYRGQLEVKVVLSHPRIEGLVARVAAGSFCLAVGPLGRREASTSHYCLAAAAIADDAEAQLLARRVRNGLRNYGRRVPGDAEFFKNLAPFLIAARSLAPDAVGECPENWH